MLDQEHPLSRLIEELKKIPSIGAKTAQRIAFYIIGIPQDEADRLGMKMFFGIGVRGRVSQVRDYTRMQPPWPKVWFTWNTAMAEALMDRFGKRKCFGGLYLSYEIDFHDHQSYGFIYYGWLQGRWTGDGNQLHLQ